MKNLYHLGYTVILLLFLTACKNENNSTNSQDTNFKLLDLKTTPNLIEGGIILDDKLLSPGRMVVKDSLVYIEDYKAEKFIHVVDWKNATYISSFAKKGQGPGELLSVSSIDLFDNALWLNDVTLAKLVRFDLDSVLLNNNFEKQEIVYKERARQNYNSVLMDSNTIVSTAFSESDKRLMFTDMNGQIIKEKFEMVKAEDDDVPTSINNMSYQGVLKINQKRDKVAIVTRYSDMLEIYNLDDDSFIRAKTHDNFPPIYEVVNSDGDFRMMQDGTTKFGYIDLTVTDDKIFALYSGKKREEGMGNYGKEIIVFNWKGEFLNSFKISNFSRAIGAIDNDHILITELVNEIPVLKKYTLNEK